MSHHAVSNSPHHFRCSLIHRLLPAWAILALVPGLPASHLWAEEEEGPTVSDVSVEVRGSEHFQLVDVTFELSHPQDLRSWIHVWGHDAGVDTSGENEASDRVYYPMHTFLRDGAFWSIGEERFHPGTHTLTWVFPADHGRFGGIITPAAVCLTHGVSLHRGRPDAGNSF